MWETLAGGPFLSFFLFCDNQGRRSDPLIIHGDNNAARDSPTMKTRPGPSLVDRSTLICRIPYQESYLFTLSL